VIATGNIQLLPLQIHEISNLVFRKNLANPNPSCGDRKGLSSIALLNRCACVITSNQVLIQRVAFRGCLRKALEQPLPLANASGQATIV
jgi:hypothetical protein